MAGHSKFANIRHKKEKQDSIRAKVFTKMAKEITVATKMGGADPSMNPRLRDAIYKAKSNNMPNDNIDRAIKKGIGGADSADYEAIVYEGYGPGGVAVMVETLTDNKTRTVANVRSAFTKGSGNMGQAGSVSFLFEKIGHILIEKDKADEENLMLLSVEAGATDFIATSEGYEIITDPSDFLAVVEVITAENIEILSSGIILKPITTVELKNETDIKNLNKTLDLLENDDDIQEIYHNAEY